MEKTAKPVLPTISPWSNTLATKNAKGFTLVEVLISMAIVVMVMAVGAPVLGRITYQRVNSQARRFVGISRTIRNDSILLSNVYRLVIDIDHSAWWVESQRRNQLISEETEESHRKKEKNKKKTDKEGDQDSNFVLADKYSKKPIALPDNVQFDGVFKEKEGQITKGIAYIHFFPSGFVEQSVIYLNKTGAQTPSYSIVIRSTAGRVEVVNKKVTSFDDEL